ncbi:MAG: hypothetical protein D6788_09685, partial [Planctomycetota bacterium]
MPADGPIRRRTFALGSNRAVPVVFALLVVAGLAVIEPSALVVCFVHVTTALLILLPAALAGLWLVPASPRSVPLRWHFLMGAGLGIGALSLLVLLLGSAGILQREVWIGLLTIAAAVGILRVRFLLKSDARSSESARSRGLKPAARADPGASHEERFAARRDPVGSESALRVEAFSGRGWVWLWLITVPFLLSALLASSAAPGLLWKEEGFGYDVLEYHLQVPKEDFLEGRITYRPHNVYAAFPSNVEMLYLLGMVIVDDPWEAGTTAQAIHLLLGVLTVAAVWTAAREWSPRAGTLAAVTLGTVGWLPYLSGLAYVEHGLLFFAAASAAALIRAGTGKDSMRWTVIAGVLAGLSAGCKYTGLPMVVVPLTVAILFADYDRAFRGIVGRSFLRRMRGRHRDIARAETGDPDDENDEHARIPRCLARAALFLAAALASLSPWLIRNLAWTGNPVFPLVNTVFRGEPPGWGAEETDHWDRSHRPPVEESSAARRFAAWWRRIAGDPDQRFGPAILLLAAAALVGRRVSRMDIALASVVLLQAVVWTFFTHVYARFAVVMLPFLALLAGRTVEGRTSRGAA